MQRIDGPSRAATLPSPHSTGTGGSSPGFFQEGDPSTATPATTVTADWANLVQEEIISVIAAAGITLDKTNHAQLLAAIQVIAQGGGFAGIAHYSANATLGSGDVGKVIVLGAGSPYTITLPAAASTPVGKAIHVFAQGTSVTIDRNGSDTIGIGSVSVTSFPISGADFFTAVSDGTSEWLIVAGTPLMQNGGTGGVFGASIGGSGYQVLPSGLIMQWGETGTTSSETGMAVTFPIAFPNACLNAQATTHIASQDVGYDEFAQVYGLTTTGMYVMNQFTAGGHPSFTVSSFWLAFGN